MKRFALLLLVVLAVPVWASPVTNCTAAGGSYLSGTVIDGPFFARGKRIQGIELSHTRLQLASDSDKHAYDLAIDNVYASDYQPDRQDVPYSLSMLVPGTRLAVCGTRFPGGIHWVHSNCGVSPTAEKPDGWVRIVGGDGQVGQSLTGSQNYCYLWG